MGVRGLTTFIANRSSQYLQSYELHDTYLVIDGNSIASQLYKWHCRCNDCFGGDYDKYANAIKSFYQLLSDCGITPLIIFDGAYEKRKIKTVYSRMRNKIGAAKRLNSVTEGSVSMFPLFLREIFVDITLKLKVKCMRCDFEGDSEAAYLARSLGCPLLSYDSDFYIFDVLYIPFSTMELRLRKKKNVNYIACDIYNVDKFLNSFGGLDKINLPLLAVLLGNDYVKRKTFAHFHRYLKIQKSKNENEQQRMIKSVIVWLKNETPESALRKILGRYKMYNRKKVAKKIDMGIKGYQYSDSQICSYFGISVDNNNEHKIVVPNPETVETISEDDLIEEEEDEDGDSSEDAEEEEEEADELDSSHESSTPSSWFQENYQKCLYPSSFMDMVVSHTYYCIPQVENYSLKHSHTISFDLLATIHKILTLPKSKRLRCIARNDYANIKKFILPRCDKKVPTLSQIEAMNLDTRKKILLEILDISDDKILSLFPSTWHVFLISLKYWITHSKNKINMPSIYSLILCGIVLNNIDNKVGFYRSTKSFFAKYSPNNTYSTSSSEVESIAESLEEISLNDGISCMQKLISYFQMDAKMKSNIRLFDVNIVHQFSEFQSCLLHIKYLNALLSFPFSTLIVSDFYDGTFLYNMTANLMKRTDLKAYIRLLLENSPQVLNTFELIVEEVEAYVGSELGPRDPPKRRKKKQKSKTQMLDVESTIINAESEEEAIFDPNNKFSLLSCY